MFPKPNPLLAHHQSHWVIGTVWEERAGSPSAVTGLSVPAFWYLK